MRASAVPAIYCDKLSMVCTSFGNFWKVVETDSAIFQDLESFGKGRFSNWIQKSFGCLLGKF